MATWVHHDHGPAPSYSGFDEDRFPVWKRAFNAQTRHQQLDDDLFAGKSVVAVLTGVVTIGVLLAIVSVFIFT